LCARGAAMSEESPSAEAAAESQAAVNVLDAEEIAALRSAEANFAQRDWNEGMKKLAAVFEKKPDALIPGSDGHTFVSVWEYFHNRIIHLPPSATEAYRSETGSLARDFENAKEQLDIDAIRRIARDHLFTVTGREALRFLAEYYYESRQFADALACVSRFEKYLAFDRNDSIRVVAMKLVCLAETGRLEELETAYAGASALLAKEEIVWQGEKMAFAQFAERLKGIARSVERRDDVGPLLPARKADAPEFPVNGAGYDGGEYPADELIAGGDLPEWQAETPFVDTYPVLGGNTLYLRLRSSLFALNVNDFSKPRWKTNFSPHGDGDMSITLGNGKAKMAAIYAVAAGEDRVFTTMKDKSGVLRLVCLDADSGKILWTGGGKGAILDSAHAASAPACIGAAVYVTAIVPRGEKGDDYYLVCLDAADGRIIYETFLCTRMASIKGGEVLYPPAPAVVADGTIYVATNAGAVCAVDMMSGRLRWAALYDKKNSVAASPGANRFERAIRREVSFAYGAPVVSGGALIVAPPEVDSLIALDAEKGDALWMLDNSDRRFAYLVGADKGAVILAGEKIGAFDIKTGRPLWGAERDLGAGVGGTGFLMWDWIVLPGDGIVTVVEAQRGAVSSRRPVTDLLKAPVPDKISGFTGNLLAGNEKIFAVSRSRVAVYPTRRVLKQEAVGP